MTVPSTVARWEYVGDGVSTTFGYGNKIFAASDLKVFFDGLPQMGGFVVTGVGTKEGGNVIFDVAPALDVEIVILRQVADDQQLDLVENDDQPAELVEQAFDRRTMVSQQIADALARAIVHPEGEALLSVPVPPKAERASKFFGWDALGNATAAAGTSADLTPVSTFVNTLLGAATAAAFRALIDAAGLAADNVFSGINAFGKIQKLAQGADVASAATLVLGDDGNAFTVTGITAITAIATKGVGTQVVLRFAGSLTLTHDAADLVLPGAADILTAPGDIAAFEEYAAGDWRCLYYTKASGEAVVTPDAFATDLLHVQDEKAAGTQGGTFTSGAWQTRDLNTEKTNEIVGASLSSNQVTLPAGTYYAEWSAPAFAVSQHATRLRNITDVSDIILGTASDSDNTAAPGTTHSLGSGRFTLAASKVIELQHRCTVTRATNGFAPGTGLQTEIFSVLKIWKVG